MAETQSDAGGRRQAAPARGIKDTDGRLVDGVEMRLNQWRARAGRRNADSVQAILSDPDAAALLRLIFAQAPYLSRCCLAHADAVVAGFEGRTGDVLSEIARDIRALDRSTGAPEVLRRALRPLKERAVAAIGIADLAGEWDVDQVGAALSDLAERMLDAAFSWALKNAQRRGKIAAQESKQPHAVLPGACLLVSGPVASDEASYHGPVAIRLLVDAGQMSEAGFDATPAALGLLVDDIYEAVLSAEGDALFLDAGSSRKPYFVETVINDIEALPAAERLWLAAARPVAGDRATGSEFHERIVPEIWASFADPAVVDVLTGGAAANDRNDGDLVAAALASLERVATTALCAIGPAYVHARAPGLRACFGAAGKAGLFDDLATGRLRDHAGLVRRVQGRCGLVGVEPGGEREVALLNGYSDPRRFETVLRAVAAEADQHWLNMTEGLEYAALEDPVVVSESVEKLEDAGFPDGRDAGDQVDRFISAHRAGDGGAKGASESAPPVRLSAEVPGLLTELGRTQDPAGGLERFFALVGVLPAEVPWGALMRSDDRFTAAVAGFVGNAPELSREAAARAEVAGEIFRRRGVFPQDLYGWQEAFPAPARENARLDGHLPVIRRWAEDVRLLAGFALASGALGPTAAMQVLSSVADRMVEAALAHARQGLMPGDHFAALALGDYGQEVLSLSSPLGLAFVCQSAAAENDDTGDETGENETGGGSAEARFARAASSVLKSLAEGHKLAHGFAVDARFLTGSGKLVSDLPTLARQWRADGGGRDLSVLMSARLIGADEVLTESFSGLIEEHLLEVSENASGSEGLPVAGRPVPQQKPLSSWDVRHVRGGLDDLDWLSAALQLRYGAEHPYVLSRRSDEVFQALARAGLLDPDVASDLIDAWRLWQNVLAVRDLAGVTDLGRVTLAPGPGAFLAGLAGVRQVSSLQPLIQGHAERAWAHIQTLLLGSGAGAASLDEKAPSRSLH